MKFKVFALSVLVVMAISCTNTSNKSSEEKAKDITIGYVDGWAEGVAMSFITKSILEQNGYKVKLQNAAVDLIFASLSNGDTDVFMDTWLPITHGAKVQKFEGKIESLGVNYDSAKIGLVVPAYVNINSIEELNANADKFDGNIIGIEKGAGITAKTDVAIEEYALSLEQMNSSSVAMLTELKKAIDKNNWIVVAGWAPHWKFGRFDLKFLDDPKGVYGSVETVETYARKGFKEEDTFAANYFAKFHLTGKQMAGLLLELNSAEDKEVAANKWVETNADLVKTWLN